MSQLICFAGAPGVGKTTAALALQKKLEERDLKVGYSPEYARDFIKAYGYPEHAAIQLHIMRQQKAWEESAFYGNDFAITDTAVWYSFIFPSLFTSNAATDQERRILRDVGRQAVTWIPSYHVTFYLPMRDVIEDDGVRDPDSSGIIDEAMRKFISDNKNEFRSLYFVPEGLTVNETVDYALARLNQERKSERTTPLTRMTQS